LIHGRGTDWLRVKDWLREKAKITEIVVMGQEFGEGKTLPEKFEWLASNVDKAIAVATPDDVGALAGTASHAFQQRARQNVWLEFGWFWGRLGRQNVLVLRRGEIEFPSDLAGLEVYPFQEDPTERSDKLRAFLGFE
jgi:predicted nucleotide-binding protein